MDLKDLNPAKQALSLFDEFKEFAFKGNVIDLAVGVIIGGAFGNLVKSLVDNVIMPILGLILPGDKGYVGWVAVIHGKEIPYGIFLGDIVNFLIVAAALFFFIVKFLGWIMSTKKEEAKALRQARPVRRRRTVLGVIVERLLAKPRPRPLHLNRRRGGGIEDVVAVDPHGSRTHAIGEAWALPMSRVQTAAARP